MIRVNDFRKVKQEVENAVNEAFDYAKKNEKNLNDFILFLANGEYDDLGVKSKLNPYMIDYRMDEIYDENRLVTLGSYINQQYTFSAENTQDSKYSLTLELMIYTHLWESKPFLKTLKKLSILCDSKSYDWKVKVKDDQKYKLINEEINGVFQHKKLSIGEVISKSYNSSLRNAFAHSEYIFGLNSPKIQLLNYKGKPHEIQEITFDNWTIRFCYSFLLGYLIHQKIKEERQKLNSGVPYEILHKTVDGKDKKAVIYYYSDRNSFYFNKQE